ncbi:unnamed protein product [Meloidogyne enterolobii]|uniref:Uncharacterized protein n=1 Tax=Meloidogyne enterolobii TaxID=390850 RepID=A0ACB0YGN1_MELEN
MEIQTLIDLHPQGPINLDRFTPTRTNKPRGRGGYKINVVENIRKSPSPIFPLLTLISLILIQNAVSYQVCLKEDNGILLAPPKKINCSIPNNKLYEEYSVEIFVPRKRPYIFTGFKCEKLIFGKSTYTFLRIYNSEIDIADILEKVSSEDCWKLIKEGRLGNKILERVDENTLKSTTNLKVDWGIFGNTYFFEFDYIISIGNIYVNFENKIVKTDLGIYYNCSVDIGECENENSTIVWEDPNKIHCPYESAGFYKGIVTNDFVVIENLQAAFVFSEHATGNITDETQACFKNNTFYMENDVFISIPLLRDFIETEKGLRIPLYPEAGIGNWDDMEAKRRKRELKRARKMTTTTKIPTSTSTQTPTSTTRITRRPQIEIITPPLLTTQRSIQSSRNPLTSTQRYYNPVTRPKFEYTTRRTSEYSTQGPEKLKIPRLFSTTKQTFIEYTTQKTELIRETTTIKQRNIPNTTPANKIVVKPQPVESTTIRVFTRPVTKQMRPIIISTTEKSPVTYTNRITGYRLPTTQKTTLRMTYLKNSRPETQKTLTNNIKVQTTTNPYIYKPTEVQSTISPQEITNKIEIYTTPSSYIDKNITLKKARIIPAKEKIKISRLNLSKAEKNEQNYRKIALNIAKFYGLKPKFLKRETPWKIGEDHKDKQAHKDTQINNNLNTKLQYLEAHATEIVKENFNKLWLEICNLHNKQIETAKTMMGIDTTLGARLWLRRQDIMANFLGEVIQVSRCIQLSPRKIFWSHEINGTCYKKVPVEVIQGNLTRILFMVSGSYAQDLVSESEKIECEKRPKSVFKDEKGQWRNIDGLTPVDMVPNFLPYKPEEARKIFRAETIFQSDLNSLMASISILHNYANRINKQEKILSLKNITYANNSNILLQIGEKTGEIVNAGIETAKNISLNPLNLFSFFGEWKNYLQIVTIVAPIIAIIGLIIYFYPWIQPILSFRPKWKREQKIRKESYQINNINSVTPSAPPIEIEMEAFIHNSVPRIYQVSNVELQPSSEPNHPFIQIIVNNFKSKALIDSGASISYCKLSVAEKIGKINFDLMPNTKAKVANGGEFFMIGKINVNIEIDHIKISTQIYVAKDEFCPFEILLGSDFMKQLQINTGYQLNFDWMNKKVKFLNFEENELRTLPMVAVLEIMPTKNTVKNKEKIILEPHTDNLVPCFIDELIEEDILVGKGNYMDEDTILIGKTLCKPDNVYARIFNGGNSLITVHQGQTIGCYYPIEGKIQPGIYSTELIENKNINKENIDKERKWQYLKDKINLEKSCLSRKAQTDLKNIIYKNLYAFVGEDGKIGFFNGPIEHKIDLVDEKQYVQLRPYRVPPGLQEEVHKQIHDMLKQNIIRPSESIFASPIVLVKKKDGKYRFAIDYRKLNQNTKKQVYFLPMISDILDKIGGKAIFTTFDFQAGFHQIGIEPKHIEKTAFATFCGVYEFLRMPFGLCGAPCTFMKVMEHLRKDLSASFLVYLDDVILGSIDEQEHLRDIENFLKILIKYNLKLKLEKCSFGRSEIKYLGFLISEEGIRPDPKNIEAVQKFKPPKTLTELRSFIGAVSYFRRFIKNFAQIMAPLHELTKLGETVEKSWTEIHQKAFEIIKDKLLTAPVLASPNFTKPFIIETDASKTAIAGCLLQKHEDGEHPISFVSRKTTPNEQKHIAAELEALAIVYCLEQFRPYIEGIGTTIVRTDNSVACSLMKSRKLVGRMAKYQLAVQAYNIKIEHRSGKSNKFCDHLSRYPNIETNEEEIFAIEREIPDWRNFLETFKEKTQDQQKDFELTKEILTQPEKWEKVSMDEIREEQGKDRNYMKIVEVLKEKDNINSEEENSEENREALENFSVIDGILYRWMESEEDSYPVIAIPQTLRERIMRECHENELLGAHLGIAKTLEKIKKRFFWKRLSSDVHNYVSACIKCQERKIMPSNIRKEPIFPITVPKSPFERIHIDIMGPLPLTIEGYKYIFTVVDAFSKWLVAVPMENQTAITVAQAFSNNFITKFGCPRSVVSDNGRQFISNIFQDLAKLYGFKHRKTTTYHPQSNGMAERLNRVIADMLFNYVNIKGDNWGHFLQSVVFAYNTSVQASTKQSPYFILFFRDPIMPIDLRLSNWEGNTREEDMSDYLEENVKGLKQIWDSVKLSIEKAQKTQKDNADRDRKEHNFKIHDLVLVKIEHLPGDQAHKFRPKWSGPYRIIEINTPVLTIREINTDKITKIHMDKAKRLIQNYLTPLRDI